MGVRWDTYLRTYVICLLRGFYFITSEMVAKSSESAIRELTKTVLALQEKIISLEKLVVDQNTHIKNLLDTRKDSSNNKSDANVGKPRIVMQRPVREARVRALSAINDTELLKQQVRSRRSLQQLIKPQRSATCPRHRAEH